MSEQRVQPRPPESPVSVAGGDPPPRTRRRRWLAAFLAVWAVVAALMGWAWYQYGQISSDLQVSNNRVAAPLKRALAPAPVGAARETTLVAGVDSHHNAAGTVSLARTDSTRHVVEILTTLDGIALERTATG